MVSKAPYILLMVSVLCGILFGALHKRTVNGLEKRIAEAEQQVAQARAERDELRIAETRRIVERLHEHNQAADAAMSTREEQHNALRDTERAVQQKLGAADSGTFPVDTVYPAWISNELNRMYRQAAGIDTGHDSASPAAGPVPGKSGAEPATADDKPDARAVDERAARLDW